MYVRFTYLYFLPDKIEEAKKIYLEETAPAIRGQKGNKEATLLEPADASNEFISSSLWEDKADIDAFEASSHYPEIIGRIKEFVSQPPVQKYFHVCS